MKQLVTLYRDEQYRPSNVFLYINIKGTVNVILSYPPIHNGNLKTFVSSSINYISI